MCKHDNIAMETTACSINSDDLRLHQTADEKIRRVQSLRNLFLIFTSLFFFVACYSVFNSLTYQYVYYRELKETNPNVTVNTASHNPCINSTGTNGTDKGDRDRAQSAASRWVMYCTVAWVIPMTTVSLIYGLLSDLYGRKPLLIVSILGQLVKVALLCCIIYWELPLYCLLLCYLLDGIGGSFAVILISTYSSIADVIPVNGNRTIYFALSNVFIAVASISTNFTLGVFIESSGYFYPSTMLLGLVGIAELLAIFGVKETYIKTEHNQSKFKISKALKFYVNKDETNDRGAYIMLSAMMFLVTIPFSSRLNIETLYLENKPFCFQSVKMSIFQGLMSFRGLTALVSIKVLQRCFNNEQMAFISMVSCAGGLLMEAFSFCTWQIFLVSVIGMFGTIHFPTVRGIMSDLTKPEDQGSMFAGLLALESLAALIAGLTANLIYQSTLTFYKGFVFLFLGGTVILSGLLMLCFMCRKKMRKADKKNNVKDMSKEV